MSIIVGVDLGATKIQTIAPDCVSPSLPIGGSASPNPVATICSPSI